MSDTYENIINLPGALRPACKVSYTLNNMQPVESTIIGDQPLFYMDADMSYEEDDILFNDEEFGLLESELSELKRSIDKFDHFSRDFVESPESVIQDFFTDKNNITLEIERETTDLQEIITVLSKSRSAAFYIEFARAHNVEFIASSQVSEACYDRKAGKILINPALDFTDQLLLAARELRRHWQHRKGALINPLMFHPDNAVLINRIQVADLVVSMIRTAWELQLSDHRQAWERIENSSLSDMGRALAREAFLDFRTLNNGTAAAAVFESWFLSERARAEDKILIRQMLADYQGYVFDIEEARTNITPTLIAALGEMPFGKNYLAEHAVTIMDDPIFTDVRDRANANFLWFIKFERSFRETEQELQTTPAPSAEGIRPSAPTQTQDQAHETQSTAQIVRLFEGHAEQSGDKSEKGSKLLDQTDSGKRTKTKGTGDNIIYLRRWSGE